MNINSSDIFGMPSPFSPYEIMQEAPNSCAVKSQQLILKMYGIDISEGELAAEAQMHGWYDPAHGTPVSDIGNLLELHNVDTEAKFDANVYDLMLQLAQGHQVIVGVDSHELVYADMESKIADMINPHGADHAIVVTGVDTRDPNDIRILVTDPGTGQATSYPVEQFKNAWEDSSFYMMHTTEPPMQHDSMTYFTDPQTQWNIYNSFTPVPFETYDPSIINSMYHWNAISEYSLYNLNHGFYLPDYGYPTYGFNYPCYLTDTQPFYYDPTLYSLSYGDMWVPNYSYDYPGYYPYLCGADTSLPEVDSTINSGDISQEDTSLTDDIDTSFI